MKIVKSLHVKYPTTQYHGCEVFTSVEMTDTELTESEQSLPAVQKSAVLGQKVDTALYAEFLRMRDIVEGHMSHKLYSILSPQVQNELARRGLTNHGK